MSDNIIQFDSLSSEQQEKLTEALVALLTHPEIKYNIPYSDCTRDWLEGNKEEALGFVNGNLRMLKNKWPKNAFTYYMPNHLVGPSANLSRDVYIFAKLPDKVALLLAVIFRPAYECYKKTLEK